MVGSIFLLQFLSCYPSRGVALLRPLPSLPLRGNVAPQGRMRGNLADNALYRAIFPSPPACREGS